MTLSTFLRSLSCTKGKISPDGSPLPSPLPSPPPRSSPARSSYSSTVPLVTKEPLPVYFRPKSVFSGRPSIVALAATTDTVHGVFCRTRARVKVALRAALNMQRKSRPLPHPPAKLREPGRCAYEDHKWKQGRCKRCLLRQSEAEDILSGGFYCDVADCGCRAQNEDDGPMDEDAPQIGPITLTPSLSSQLALDPSFFPDPPLATDRNIPEGILWTIRRVGSSIANVSDTSSVSSLHVPETRLPRSPGYMDLRSALDHPDHPDQPLPGSQAVREEVDYHSFLAQLPITATLLSAQADAALSRRRSDRSAGPEPSTRPTTGQQQERLYHWTILNLRHRESRSAGPEPSTRTGSVEQPSAGPSRNASQK